MRKFSRAQVRKIFLAFGYERRYKLRRMAWSETKFKRRVEERAATLGIGVDEVMRRANLSHDYLDKTPQHGRRIDAIQAIAAVLGWNLAEAVDNDHARLLSDRMSLIAITARQLIDHVNSIGHAKALVMSIISLASGGTFSPNSPPGPVDSGAAPTSGATRSTRRRKPTPDRSTDP